MESIGRDARRDAPDRRRHRRFRFVDRRTGFDRRVDYPVLGTMRDHEWIVLAALIALNALSLLDGLLTAAELATGLASEGNPVLRALIGVHPWAAVAVKIGAIIGVSLIIWHGRRVRIVLATSLVALAVFAAVVAYHLGSLDGFGFI